MYGCENNKHNIKQFEKFSVEKNIKMEYLSLDSTTYIDYPIKIIQNDSIIFILDIGNSTDYYIHCYSATNYQHLKSTFKKGQGPNEYISINNIQILNDTLYAYGIANEVFYTSVKNNDLNSPIQKIKIDDDFGFLVRGFKTKNKFYFPVFNIENANRMLEFDKKGNYLSSFGEIISKNGINSAPTFQAYFPFIHGNSDYIVAAAQFGEIIEIYDLNNKNQINLLGKKGYPEFNVIKNIAINKGIMGFEDVYITDNYIYALFNGEKVIERTVDQQGGKYIYVFDFKGRPLMKLILNRYSTSLFVDSKDSVMYLLDVNSNSPLFVTTLPSILDSINIEAKLYK